MAQRTASPVDGDWVTITPPPAAAPNDGDWETIDGTPKPSWFDPAVNAVADFSKGLNATGNPLTGQNRQAASDLLFHPVDTVQHIAQAQNQLGADSMQSFKNKDYLNGIRHAISFMLPVIGPVIDAAGNKAGTGHVFEGLGEAAGIALPLALGMREPQPSSSGGLLGKLQAKASETSRNLYQGALKPPTTAGVSEVRSMVDTGLTHSIPVSAAGVEKLNGLVDAYNTAIDSKIKAQGAAGATVNKFKVASRLNDTAKRFETQATPTEDLNIVSKAGNDFLNTKPNEIPIVDAQNIKKGTYQQLRDKAFGTVQTADKEAQKALARGLKEEIAAQIPELTALNAEEGKALGLDAALEKAVNRTANRTGKKMGGIIAGGMVGAVSGSPVLATGVGMLKMVLEDPEMRSQLAIGITKAQRKLPMKGNFPSMKQALARIDNLAASLATANDRGTDTASQTPTQ